MKLVRENLEIYWIIEEHYLGKQNAIKVVEPLFNIIKTK